MKKLLIVLIAVAMASFLFVGCLGVTPDPDEPVDPDEPGICPKVEVTSEVEVEGKNYIKGGKQKITVTFAVPTEPVSVYVGFDIKTFIYILPGYYYEVVMYPNDDKTIYTGDFVFTEYVGNDCNEAYIYVGTCETCDYCKYPYTVDNIAPYANIEITNIICTCPENSYLKFDSAWTGDPGGCCGDTCSELASWIIGIYDRDPFDLQGDVNPCAKLLDSVEGIACPILWITDCKNDWLQRDYHVLIELKDVVGNSIKKSFDLLNLPKYEIIGEGCPL